MKSLITFLLCFLTGLFTQGIFAQTVPKYIIHYNEKGQLSGELPETITNGDLLAVSVSGSKDPMDAYVKRLKAKAAAAGKRAADIRNDAKFADAARILKNVYGIGPAELQKIIDDCAAIISNPYATPANKLVPAIGSAKDYYKIEVKDQAASTVSFGYNATSANFVATPTENRLMLLNLSFTDKFKKLAFDLFSNNRTEFHEITATQMSNWADYKTKEEQYIKDLKDLLAAPPGKDMASVKAAMAAASKLHADISSLIALIKPSIDLSINQPWMLHWFWYQENRVPALNPFKFAALSSLGTKPDTSENVALRAKIQARIDYLKNKKDLSTAEADKLIEQMATYRKGVNKNVALLENYTKVLTANEAILADFMQYQIYLNSASFYLSDNTADKPYMLWMRHHNAADDHELMTLNPRKEYLEDEYLVALDHNLNTDQQVSIEFAYTPITNSQSLLADELVSAIKQVGTLEALTVGGSSQLAEEQELSAQKRIYNQAIKDLKKDLPELQELDTYLDYLLAQTNVDKDVKENPATAFTYHTKVQKGGDVTGDQQGTYVLKTTTATTGTANTTAATAGSTGATTGVSYKFRVNKRYRIFPMAGFAYTTDQFSSVGANSDGIAPGKITQEPALHLIAGLKFYIQKTNIRNPQFFTGKDANNKPLFWTRTHIDVAVAVSDPMRNIFVGGGLDMWPGFSFNTGLVFNRYTYNTYGVGSTAQSRTLYRPGFYLGLTTDVAVITEFAKLLTSGK